MSTNGNGQFLESELIHRKVKVDNEWQTRTFPVVGGRLRLAHEENQTLNLQTEMVNWDGQYAIFKCCAVTSKGQFVGYGTANSQRDARLAESLVELAETRSVARALRFAGYGLEFCSAEEIAHIPEGDPEPQRTADKQRAPAFPEDNGNGKSEAKAPSGAAAETGSKPKSAGNGAATQAQVRALFALSRKANYQEADVGEMLSRFEVSRFEDLSRQDASQLIGNLQTQVAA
ncbi:MAG: hypothetical protein ACLP5H_13970 [Desulfomonilaceae bacterium]